MLTQLDRRLARKYTVSKKGHVRNAGGSEPIRSDDSNGPSSTAT